jgi:hypothetical protein
MLALKKAIGISNTNMKNGISIGTSNTISNDPPRRTTTTKWI